MFCLQCGTTIPDVAHFCSQCGMAVVDMEQQYSEPVTDSQQEHHAEFHHDNHKPVLVVKPKVALWVILTRYLPTQINLTFIGAVIFGLMAVGYHLWSGTLVHPVRPFVFFGIFFFVAISLLIYAAYQKTINSVRYEFYRDRMEYYDGLWNVQHKILYYKHITEITLHRNMIQRFYGIGTIHFAVPVMGPKYRGLFLSDVQHPEKLYEQIEQIVGAY